MKATILQENILKATQDALKCVSSRPQLPILSCILIRAKKGEISCTATDLNRGIEIVLGGKILKEGECAVPAKIFNEILSSLTPGNVELSLEEETLTLSTSQTTTTIQCMSPKDFPPFPKAGEKKISLNTKTFLEVVQAIHTASGIDETRPIFTAMLLRLPEKGEGIEAVCTDGYRLARFNSLKKDEKETTPLLVPTQFLLEVARIAERSTSKTIELSVSPQDKQLVVLFNHTTLLTRLIDGSFPEYERIFPQEFQLICSISKEELKQAVKAAMVFARESSGIIQCVIEDEKMKVLSSSNAMGTHVSTVSIVLEKGTQGKIAFNGKYLLDVLSIIKDDHVWFGMNESLQPAEFRDPLSPSLRYVVMPFRVQG